MSAARVLICDDELLIRLWLEEHLREAGHAAEGLADGQSRIVAMSVCEPRS